MSDANAQPSDQELLARLAAGQHGALGVLYDRHVASLFRHACALTSQAADAEDLVHGVFVKVAGMGPDLLGVRKPVSYLHRMLHTAWLDAGRRATTGERVTQQHARETPGWGELRDGKPELALDLARALGALPALEREAIVLHVVQGLSFREIGQVAGVSLFTAAGRYRTGIGRLRQTLEGKGRHEPA